MVCSTNNQIVNRFEIFCSIMSVFGQCGRNSDATGSVLVLHLHNQHNVNVHNVQYVVHYQYDV